MTMTAPDAAPDKSAAIQRRVVFSTLSNVLNKVVTLGVWFWLTPFILGQLGASLYGLWVLVGSVVAYGTLLDLGVAQAVTKYVAADRARGRLAEAQPLIATALWLYLLLGLLALLLSALLAPFFPLLFTVPPEQRALAQGLVLLSGASLGVSLPTTATAAILRGLQRHDYASLIGILGTSLYAAATVIVLLAGGGALGLMAINIPLSLLMQIPTLWLIRRAAPDLHVSLRGASLRHARQVFAFSSALVVINVAGQLQSKTDEVVIGAFLPLANVTPYSLARRLSDIPNTFTDQFMRVLMPLAAQLHAEEDAGRLRALYIASTRLTLAIGLPLAAGVAVLSRPFLSLWVGPAYGDAAPLVTILVTASLIDTTLWPASNILQGMARHRPLALLALATGLANLGISIALVRPFGVAGVALGTLIPAVIETLFIVTPYALRQLGIPFRTLLRQIAWPALAPLGPTLAVLFALRAWLQPASYVALGLIGVATVATYALGYLALTRGQPEQELLWRALRRVRGWVMPIAS